MTTTTVKHTYKLKRGKQDAVERANPLLLAGEPIVVYCNDGKTRLKIGNGRDYYLDLGFIGGTGSGSDIIVDKELDRQSTNPVQNKVITQELDKKVDKEFGKGLSTNDFTNADKMKLESIQEGATQVTIDSTQLDLESGNAVANSLVAQEFQNVRNLIDVKILNVETTMDQAIDDKVTTAVDEVIPTLSLDGGQI